MNLRKFFRKSFLVSVLLMASFMPALAQTGVAPSVVFFETDQTLPDGLWRWHLNGDILTIEKNTAAANNFTTITTAISIAANGDVTFPQSIFVTGSATVSVNTSITGNLTIQGFSIIDFNHAEAFLVRKNADGGDIFIIDTENDEIEIPTGILILGLNESLHQDRIIFDGLDMSEDGQIDSGAILFTGLSHESATPHDADWKQFVDVTSNAGASTLTFQSRIDAGGFANRFTVTDAGDATFAGGSTYEGAVLIDVDNVEAFLVRKDGDAGDVFIVDTTNDEIEIPTGALILGLGNVATQDSIIIDGTDRVGNGQTDSGAIILTGLGYESATPHDADWKQFVNVTANTGASTWTLQTRIDAAGYANVLTISDAGRATFAGGATFEGTVLIDKTDTVALKVRQDGEGADVLIVDTTNLQVKLGSTASLVLPGVGTRELLFADATGVIDGNVNLTWNSSNRLGVGVASADVKLHVSQGAGSYSAVLKLQNNSPAQDRGPYIQFDLDVEQGRIGAAQEGASNNNEGYLRFDTRLADTVSEKMRLTSAGVLRVGVLGSDGDDEAPPELISVIDGNVEVRDSGTLGSETITDGDMSSTTNWAGATDWSDTIAGTTVYLHSAGNGTLTQTAAQRVTDNEGFDSRWYKFTYTVSSVTDVGANVLTITNAFAASAVTLDISSAATRSVIFQSHATNANTADFVLSATSDTASDTFTLDDLILKEIQGGNLILAGKITGGGTGGLTIDEDGNRTLDGVMLGTTQTFGRGSDGNTTLVIVGANESYFIKASGFNMFLGSNGNVTIGMQINGSNQLSIAPAEVLISKTLKVRGTGIDNSGARLVIDSATAVLSMSSGSSVSASSLIPAGSWVLGVIVRVNDLVTGPAGFDVGDGVDVDRWGNSISVADTTATDGTDFTTSGPMSFFPAATDVVITTDGVDFTGGNIRVVVYSMSFTALVADN